MATVFPWTSASPLVAAAVMVSLLLTILLLVLGHAKLRASIEKLQRDDPHAPFWRRGRFVRRCSKAVRWTALTAGVYALAYAGTWIWAPLGALFFTPLATHAIPILIILGTLLVASLATEIARDIPERAQQLAAWRGRKANRQVVHALELFLRYSIWTAAAALVIASALDIVGLQGDVGASLLAWVRSQAGTLVLLGSLIAIAWVGARIIRAIAGEVRQTTTRVSPQVVDALGATARGVLYAVLTLVGIFTLLQAVGLGSVGGTLVVVLSSFIGLTVAMAGTGSIGNALSGMVLLGFRPYVKGDRVVVADDLTCDVEDVTLMFTRVRTLANEVTEIPNNQILLKRIRNLSRSGSHAIVVKLGIGYDVSHGLVRELATKAATTTEGVLKDPAPQVYARELANYAIDYELYAYTSDPRHLGTRSALLGRLQEVFYAAGVEIMTPDMHVVRKGRLGEEEGAVRIRVAGPPGPSPEAAPSGRAPPPG